jgi:AraC-like DNA-binding protein
VDLEEQRTTLDTGDIAAFPFGTPHVLGAGRGSRLIDPGGDLPEQPWSATPTLHYPAEGHQVRILCGYVQCEAMGFAPFRAVLPKFLHIRTAGTGQADWLAATVAQIVTEVDRPQPGGGPVVERLTELAFLEILRRAFQSVTRTDQPKGWLAAIVDPALAQGLAALHADPAHAWTLDALARSCGLSRSALVSRFAAVLGTSPMRYLRDWRLYLASESLAATPDPIIAVALEAGYATEAAFTRAFSQSFGVPPAEWRRRRT